MIEKHLVHSRSTARCAYTIYHFDITTEEKLTLKGLEAEKLAACQSYLSWCFFSKMLSCIGKSHLYEKIELSQHLTLP